MSEVRVILPLPPSVNATYKSREGKGMTRSPVYWKWKSECDALWTSEVKLDKDKLYEFDLEFRYKWISKSGKPLVRDGDNRIKNLQDYVAEKFGVNDCTIWKWVVVKHHVDRFYGAVCILREYLGIV